MITFDLTAEQIFKVIGCPVAEEQFETHAGNAKLRFVWIEFLSLLCSSVYYPCYVSSVVSTWMCSVSNA